MWSVRRGSAASAAVESPLRLPASALQWCHVHWCVRRALAVTVLPATAVTFTAFDGAGAAFFVAFLRAGAFFAFVAFFAAFLAILHSLFKGCRVLNSTNRR